MRSFSIVTTCKGRLDHLKRSLPRMLEQGAKEVVVVDYSCPEGTADYVEREFPAARVVRIEGETGFSNWKARNAGAAAAGSDMLVFCDADTILAPDALGVIAKAVSPGSFGRLAPDSKAGKRGLSENQLRGFQVVPSEAFQSIDGYDELFAGYAAGGDTDLGNRLRLRGLKVQVISNAIIEAVIEHDHDARLAYHSEPVAVSYATGLLYRRLKAAYAGVSLEQNIPLAMRKQLYAVARKAGVQIAAGKNPAGVNLKFGKEPVGMPRQLGYERGEYQVSVKIGLVMAGKLKSPA